MDDVTAKARSMGATDEAIERWLDLVDPATGQTPRLLIAEGHAADVLDMLGRMEEGVFA